MGWLVLVVVGACGSDGVGTDGATGRFTAMKAGACRAATEAGRTQVESARAVFFDDVHQPLHELAAEAADRDRGVGAELLESKQRVEAGLENGAADLTARFDRLLAAIDAAMDATDQPRAACAAP